MESIGPAIYQTWHTLTFLSELLPKISSLVLVALQTEAYLCMQS